MKQRIAGAMLVLLAAIVLGFTGAAPEAQASEEDAQPEAETQAEAEAAALDMSNERTRISYALGTRVGAQLGSDYAIELEALVAGIRDAMGGGDLLVNEQELGRAMQAYQQKVQEARAESGQALDKEAQEVLAKNRENPDITETDSGLQYRVVEEGEGATPEADDEVKVHYEGRFVDGEVFDSSYERGEPAVFNASRVISGWTEGLQLMKEGAKYRFWIPGDLAYGPSGRGGIPPNATLVFDVELLEVMN
ncbi:MAG: FKBP-type peptidyl-prolyl cis-trans isomerase [Candidatus Hydrogenedentota bacterium]